jgi:flagellar biosynthesis/type III secretory pathway protein FliH
MPGPGSSQTPTLSTFAEIGCFCNPVTAMSTAVICNTLLWSIIQELLENAKTKAFKQGRKEGYSDGYNEGRYLVTEDEEKGHDAALEEGKKLGREEGLKSMKHAEEQAYKNGWREGHEAVLNEGKEEQEVTSNLAYEKGRMAE